MKLFLGIVIATLGASALSAQATVQTPYGYSNALGVDTSWRQVEGYVGRGSLETPSMRRQKLARAIALRDEVAVLQARDGGTLSPRSVAYVRRKSRAILSYQR